MINIHAVSTRTPDRFPAALVRPRRRLQGPRLCSGIKVVRNVSFKGSPFPARSFLLLTFVADELLRKPPFMRVSAFTGHALLSTFLSFFFFFLNGAVLLPLTPEHAECADTS